MTDDKRLELAHRFERASFASGVGISLGVWAGRGDWASMSESARNDSGHRALTELDQLLAKLTDFRQELAAAVQPGDTDTGTHPEVTRYTVSCIPEAVSPADHDLWSVTVEYTGAQRWAVRRLGECLGTDGQWVYEPRSSELSDEWLADHRFDRATALRLAVEAAPHVEVNGMTAAQVLARHTPGKSTGDDGLP